MARNGCCIVYSRNGVVSTEYYSYSTNAGSNTKPKLQTPQSSSRPSKPENSTCQVTPTQGSGFEVKSGVRQPMSVDQGYGLSQADLDKSMEEIEEGSDSSSPVLVSRSPTLEPSCSGSSSTVVVSRPATPKEPKQTSASSSSAPFPVLISKFSAPKPKPSSCHALAFILDAQSDVKTLVEVAEGVASGPASGLAIRQPPNPPSSSSFSAQLTKVDPKETELRKSVEKWIDSTEKAMGLEPEDPALSARKSLKMEMEIAEAMKVKERRKLDEEGKMLRERARKVIGRKVADESKNKEEDRAVTGEMPILQRATEMQRVEYTENCKDDEARLVAEDHNMLSKSNGKTETDEFDGWDYLEDNHKEEYFGS